MDETGILKEDQIYCSVMSDIVTGSVVITRCPALHPGDIRCVNAVNVPVESPLRDLHNVIVFSQRGQRVSLLLAIAENCAKWEARICLRC